MSTDALVALLAVLASLILATRALSAQNLRKAQIVRMGGIWALIIGVLYLLISVLM